VLVFSTAYLPFIGGAEVALAEVMKRSTGLRFLVITARLSRGVPKRESQGDIDIYRIGFGSPADKLLLPIFGAFVGFRAIRRERVAALWGMMVSQGTLAGYFLKIIFPRTRFVVTLQEGDSKEHLEHARFGLIDFFWKRVMRKADAVTAISKHLARAAREAGFRKEVAVIPNGVDEAYVSASFERPPKETLKTDLGIPANAPVILSVSRLVEKNGIDDLFRAFALLAESAHLVIVGGGPDHKKLMRLAHELGVDNRAHFLGSVNHDELLRYYRMSDIFCRPSRSEGLGSAFLEAMGAGVPVVATAVGGIRDFLIDGETGVAVQVGDPENIANGIRRIFEDDVLRNKIVERARALVIEKYLWVDIAKKMESVLLEAQT